MFHQFNEGLRETARRDASSTVRARLFISSLTLTLPYHSTTFVVKVAGWQPVALTPHRSPTFSRRGRIELGSHASFDIRDLSWRADGAQGKYLLPFAYLGGKEGGEGGGEEVTPHFVSPKRPEDVLLTGPPSVSLPCFFPREPPPPPQIPLHVPKPKQTPHVVPMTFPVFDVHRSLYKV
ncbi:unnamed protein product [Pleuronectes platessa]|uniref:Uncharacterized protein n=1 Tax=Pleuronectes platessa TaxID=8262 RepID=A0A9N7UGK8_PLEPL|nr:unnamed protein product [Pleuronectes platessa]